MTYSTHLVQMQDCMKSMHNDILHYRADEANPWYSNEAERHRKLMETYALAAIAAGLGELMEDTKQMRSALISLARTMKGQQVMANVLPNDTSAPEQPSAAEEVNDG